MPVVPILGRLRQEDHESETSLNYTVNNGSKKKEEEEECGSQTVIFLPMVTAAFHTVAKR
jgi:hypothetical protein